MVYLRDRFLAGRAIAVSIATTTPSCVVGCARATEVATGLRRDRSRRVRSW